MIPPIRVAAGNGEYMANNLSIIHAELADVLADRVRTPTPHESDAIVLLVQELTRDWKRGRRIKVRQMMQLAPAVFRAVTGLSVATLDVTDDRRTAMNGDAPSARAIRRYCATLVGRSTNESDVARAFESGLYDSYWHARAAEYGAPCVFDAESSIIERLLDTDLPDRSIPLRMPLPAFMVRLPSSLLETEDPARPGVWLDVSCMMIVGSNNGTHLDVQWLAEPCREATNFADDAACSRVVDLSTRQHHPQGSLATIRYRGSVHDDSIMGILAVNFIAYLCSERGVVKPSGANRPWAEARATLESCPKRTKVMLGKHYATWTVNDSVKRYELTATDILVRGHWRHQSHGPKHSLRRLTWIEPFVRRATDAMPLGHDYVTTEDHE